MDQRFGSTCSDLTHSNLTCHQMSSVVPTKSTDNQCNHSLLGDGLFNSQAFIYLSSEQVEMRHNQNGVTTHPKKGPRRTILFKTDWSGVLFSTS